MTIKKCYLCQCIYDADKGRHRCLSIEEKIARNRMVSAAAGANVTEEEETTVEFRQRMYSISDTKQ